MSGNRRKNTSSSKAAADRPSSARVVAIPKEGEVPLSAPQPAPKPKQAPKQPERIGDILRQARMARNEDLYQIAEYLCIKPAFLVALENSHYEKFPADAYVIGFLRTYANFLGVDGKDAIDRYRYEMAGRRKKPVLSMPVAMGESRAPSALIMTGATVAALLIYALWYGVSSGNRAQLNAPPPLPAATSQSASEPSVAASSAAGLTAPVPVAPPTSPASAATPPASSVAATTVPAPGIALDGNSPAAKDASKEEDGDKTAKGDKKDDKADKNSKTSDKKDDKKEDDPAAEDKDTKPQVYGDAKASARLVIRAMQSSWVMVTDSSGKAIFDHVLKAGDTYKVPNKPGLSLTTGNGSGIALTLDGHELPKVANGAPHVVRDIPLDPDRLTSGGASSAQ